MSSLRKHYCVESVWNILCLGRFSLVATPARHRRPPLISVCEIEWAPARRNAFSVARNDVKHRKGRVIYAQTQRPLSSMRNHPHGLELQLLHHRLDAMAFDFVAHWRIGLVQGVLSNQTQQIHSHSCELADQTVGVKLARRQPLQIPIGLELRMELLMRGVIAVKHRYICADEHFGQRIRPALQNVFGQQQRVVIFVDGALGEPIDTAHRIDQTPHMGQLQSFLPQAFALIRTLAHPLRAGVSHSVCCDSFHRRLTWISLDDV